MTPLEKFKQWTSENRAWFKEKYLVLSKWIPNDQERRTFMDREWERACLWLIKNESQRKARKKDWGKFLMNWYVEEIDRQNYRNSHMTWQQDMEFHEDKKISRRRAQKGEFEDISNTPIDRPLDNP